MNRFFYIPSSAYNTINCVICNKKPLQKQAKAIKKAYKTIQKHTDPYKWHGKREKKHADPYKWQGKRKKKQ
jgi:hypothetical protein